LLWAGNLAQGLAPREGDLYSEAGKQNGKSFDFPSEGSTKGAGGIQWGASMPISSLLASHPQPSQCFRFIVVFYLYFLLALVSLVISLFILGTSSLVIVFCCYGPAFCCYCLLLLFDFSVSYCLLLLLDLWIFLILCCCYLWR
jgi:hypothetical protein